VAFGLVGDILPCCLDGFVVACHDGGCSAGRNRPGVWDVLVFGSLVVVVYFEGVFVVRFVLRCVVVVVGVVGLLGVVVVSASAEELPNILPEGTEKAPLSGTSKSGLSVFGNGVITIESEKSKGLFSSAVKKLGTFDLLFEKVHLSERATEECKGLQVGEEKGSILVLGTFHIRHYNANPGKTLFTAIIFLLKEVHILCSGPIEILVNGCMAGLLLPENKLAKVLTADLKVKKGDSEIITVLNETSGC
jgi:hypothetical protein